MKLVRQQELPKLSQIRRLHDFVKLFLRADPLHLPLFAPLCFANPQSCGVRYDAIYFFKGADQTSTAVLPFLLIHRSRSRLRREFQATTADMTTMEEFRGRRSYLLGRGLVCCELFSLGLGPFVTVWTAILEMDQCWEEFRVHRSCPAD